MLEVPCLPMPVLDLIFKPRQVCIDITDVRVNSPGRTRSASNRRDIRQAEDRQLWRTARGH